MSSVLNIIVHLDAALLLASVMVVAHVYVERAVLDAAFDWLRTRVRSRRLLLALVSAVFGVMPIPGRISVISAVLDTLKPKDQPAPEFGIVAYLASHHYYLWSPMEKSVVLSMAGLGISYQTFMGWIAPPLLVLLAISVAYIFIAVPEDRIAWIDERRPAAAGRGIDLLLFITAFVAAIAGVSSGLSFGALAVITMLRHRVSLRSAAAAVDWRLVAVVVGVVVAGQLIQQHSAAFEAWFQGLAEDGLSIWAGGAVAFSLSFILGSSARYAAIAVLGAAIYGRESFVFFFLVDFAGYLLSPTHKCVWIGRMYFGTSLARYYRMLTLVAASMLAYASITTALQ